MLRSHRRRPGRPAPDTAAVSAVETALASARRPNLRARQTAAAFLLLLAAGSFAVGVWGTIDSLDLLNNGVRARAQVIQIEGSDYLLDESIGGIPADPTTPHYVWTGDVYGKPKVGDVLTMVHKRSDPTSAHDLRTLQRWWAVPLLTGLFGIFVAWVAVRLFRL